MTVQHSTAHSGRSDHPGSTWLPRAPERMYDADLFYQDDRLHANLTYHYTGLQLIGLNGNGLDYYLQPVKTLDFSASYDLPYGFGVGLSVKNLLNSATFYETSGKSKRYLAYDPGADGARWRRHAMVLLVIGLAQPAHAEEDMRLDQVVVVYRHGVRSPLPGEIQVDEVHGKAWPAWPVAPSILTPHGREGVMAMGRYDRAWMSAADLFPDKGCPAAGSVAIWANTDQRTIASGQAYADAFAPGCTVAVGHLPEGSADPLFNPVAAGAVEWDGKAALATIQRETHGPDALTTGRREAMTR
ncbi:hypothetical protein KCV01_g24952, partial [Aureobasidium melanogenum]